MAHTPGPWDTIWHDDKCRIRLNGSAVYAVEDMCGSGGNNPDDLRLMVAAPDLLDAVADLLAIVEDEYENDSESSCLRSWRLAIQAATKAIKKANGVHA